MEQLVQLLTENNLTLSSIESVTGGLFSHKMTEVSNVSKVYRGAVVVYQTQTKVEIANVDEKLIRQYGVVSYEVAYEMAKKCQEMFKSDIAVSFTGNAGPNALDNLPVGTVFSAIYFNGNIEVFNDFHCGTRSEIKEKIVELMTKRLVYKLRETKVEL